MSLRRKSMEKSSSKKLPRTEGHNGTSSLRFGISSKRLNSKNISAKSISSAKRQAAVAADLTLDTFLDTSSLVAPPPGNTPQESDTTFKKVEEAKQRLGNLECEIISALFPADGNPESFESLAVRLGMSVKEVREVADNALRGLRGTKGSPPRPSSVWN